MALRDAKIRDPQVHEASTQNTPIAKLRQDEEEQPQGLKGVDRKVRGGKRWRAKTCCNHT
jgi:hypothetical protein